MAINPITIPLTIGGLQEAKAQLDELGKAIENAETPKEKRDAKKRYRELAKEVDKAADAFIELDKSGRRLNATFEDIYGDMKPLTGRIGEMEDRMYELALAGQANTDEFRELSAEVVKMKATIRDVDKQVDVLADNRGLGIFTDGISQIGMSIQNLDFGGAMKGIKQLSGAFVKMGASLLVNPIFLMAAVITAIVGAIALLLSKLGLLKPILDAIKAVIGTVIQALKDLSDWFGFTSFAAEEAAEKQLKANEKLEESYKRRGEAIVKGLDQEIAMAQIEGKNTVDLEIKKQEAIIETNRARYTALQGQLKALRASGKATEEEVKKLLDSMRDLREGVLDAQFEIKKIEKQATVDLAKTNEDKLKADQDSYQKRLEAQKKFHQDRLNAERQIRDLELQLQDDGLRKDLALLKEKYKRQIEDIKANENLNSEEKKKLTRLLKETEFEEEKAIQQQDADRFSQLLEASREAKKKRDEELRTEDLADRERASQQLLEQEAIAQEKRLALEASFEQARVLLKEGIIGSLTALEDLLAQSGAKTAGLQKTLALVQIATDTAKAISATIAGASQAAAAGGPAAPFLLAGYIASGIATVLTAVASAKKALSSAPSIGGSVGSGGGTARPSLGGSQPVTPNTQLFGNSNNANEFTSSKSQESEIVVKAVVSETEVTTVQNKIKKINEGATL